MTTKLKELIIRRTVEMNKGYDIEDDIVKIFDNTYLVDCINGRVEEIR